MWNVVDTSDPTLDKMQLLNNVNNLQISPGNLERQTLHLLYSGNFLCTYLWPAAADNSRYKDIMEYNAAWLSGTLYFF